MPGIRVSARTRALVRLAARRDRLTHGQVVDLAVAEYVERHRAELEAGFDYARSILIPEGTTCR